MQKKCLCVCGMALEMYFTLLRSFLNYTIYRVAKKVPPRPIFPPIMTILSMTLTPHPLYYIQNVNILFDRHLTF